MSITVPNSMSRKYKKINRREGRWTLNENLQYLAFLEDNLPLFENIDSRRKGRAFRTMSNNIV